MNRDLNNLYTSRESISEYSIYATRDNTSISENKVNDIGPPIIEEVNAQPTEDTKPTSILDHSVSLSPKSSDLLNKYSLATPLNKVKYPVLKFFQNIYLNICKFLDIAPKSSKKLHLSKNIFESFLKNEAGVNEKPQTIIKFILVQMENQLKGELADKEAQEIREYVDNLKFLSKAYDILDSISSNSDIPAVNRDFKRLTKVVEKKFNTLDEGQKLLLPAPLKYKGQIGQGLFEITKQEDGKCRVKVITFDSNFEDNLFTLGNKKYPFIEWDGVDSENVFNSISGLYQYQHPFYGAVKESGSILDKGVNLILDLLDEDDSDSGTEGLKREKNPLDILSTYYDKSPNSIDDETSLAKSQVKAGKEYRNNKLFLYVLKDTNPRLYQESSLYIEAKTIEMIWSENPEIKTDSHYCHEIETSIRKLMEKASKLGLDIGSLSNLKGIQKELVKIREAESVDFTKVKTDPVQGSAPLSNVTQMSDLKKSKVQVESHRFHTVANLRQASINIIGQLNNRGSVTDKCCIELSDALVPLYEECRELYNEGSMDELQILIQDIVTALPLTEFNSKEQIYTFSNMLTRVSKQVAIKADLQSKVPDVSTNDSPDNILFDELGSMLFECYKVSGHTSSPNLLATTALLQTFTNLSSYKNMDSIKSREGADRVVFIPPRSILDRMNQDPHFIITDPLLRQKSSQMVNFWSMRYVEDKTLSLLPVHDDFVQKLIEGDELSRSDLNTMKNFVSLNIQGRKCSNKYSQEFNSIYKNDALSIDQRNLYQAINSISSEKDVHYTTGQATTLRPPFSFLQRMEAMQEVMATDSRTIMGSMASNVSVCVSYLNKQSKADALSRNSNIRGLFKELHSNTKNNLSKLPSKDKSGDRKFSKITFGNEQINFDGGYNINFGAEPNLGDEWYNSHDYLNDSTFKGIQNNFDENFIKSVIGFELADSNKSDYSALTEKTLIGLDTQNSIDIDPKYKTLMLSQQEHGLQTLLTTYSQDIHQIEDNLIFDFICHKLSSVGSAQDLYQNNKVLFESFQKDLNDQLAICLKANNFLLAGRINYLLYQLNISTSGFDSHEMLYEYIEVQNDLIESCRDQTLLPELHMKRLELLNNFIQLNSDAVGYRWMTESLAALSLNPILDNRQTAQSQNLINNLHNKSLGFYFKNPERLPEVAPILLRNSLPSFDSIEGLEVDTSSYPTILVGKYAIDLNTFTVSEEGLIKSYLPEVIANTPIVIQTLASNNIDVTTTSFNKTNYRDRNTNELVSIYTPEEQDNIRIIEQLGKAIVQEKVNLNGKDRWVEKIASHDASQLIGLDRLPYQMEHLFNKGQVVRELKHPDRMHIISSEGKPIYTIKLKVKQDQTVEVKSVINSEGYTLALLSDLNINHINFIEKIDSKDHVLAWVDKNKKLKTIEYTRIQSDEGITLSLHIQEENRVITSGMLDGYELLANAEKHPSKSFLSRNDLPLLSSQYFLLHHPEKNATKVLFAMTDKQNLEDVTWTVESKNSYNASSSKKQPSLLLDLDASRGNFNIHKMQDHEKAFLGYVYMSAHQYEDAIKFIDSSYHQGSLHPVQLSAYDYILDMPDKSPEAKAIKLKTQIVFLKNLKQQKERVSFDTEVSEYKLLMSLRMEYEAIEESLTSSTLKLSAEEKIEYDQLISLSIIDTLSLSDTQIVAPKVRSKILEKQTKRSSPQTLALKLWMKAKPQKSTSVQSELSLSGDKSLTRGIETWFNQSRAAFKELQSSKSEAIKTASQYPLDITPTLDRIKEIGNKLQISSERDEDNIKLLNNINIVAAITSPTLNFPLLASLEFAPDKYLALSRQERHEILLHHLHLIKDSELADEEISAIIGKTIEQLNELSEFEQLKLHPHFVCNTMIGSIQTTSLINHDIEKKFNDLVSVASDIQEKAPNYAEKRAEAFQIGTSARKIHDFFLTFKESLGEKDFYIYADNTCNIKVKNNYTIINILDHLEVKLNESKLNDTCKMIIRLSFNASLEHERSFGGNGNIQINPANLVSMLNGDQQLVANQIFQIKDSFFSFLQTNQLEIQASILAHPQDFTLIDEIFTDFFIDILDQRDPPSVDLLKYMFPFFDEDIDKNILIDTDTLSTFFTTGESLTELMETQFNSCSTIYSLPLALNALQKEADNPIPDTEYKEMITSLITILNNKKLTSHQKISLIQDKLCIQESYSEELKGFLTQINEFLNLSGKELIEIATSNNDEYSQAHDKLLAKFTLVWKQTLDMDQDPFSKIVPYSNSKDAFPLKSTPFLSGLGDRFSLQKFNNIYSNQIFDPNSDLNDPSQREDSNKSLRYNLFVNYVEHMLNSESTTEEQRAFLETLMEKHINVHFELSGKKFSSQDWLTAKKYESLLNIYVTPRDPSLYSLGIQLSEILNGDIANSMYLIYRLNEDKFPESSLMEQQDKAAQSLSSTMGKVQNMMPTTSEGLGVQSYLNKYAKLLPLVTPSEFDLLKFPEEWSKRSLKDQVFRAPNVYEKQPKALMEFFSNIDLLYEVYFGTQDSIKFQRTISETPINLEETEEESIFDSFESNGSIQIQDLFDPQGLYELNQIIESAGHSIDENIDIFDVVDILRKEKKLGLLRDLKAKKNLNAQAKKYIENIEVDVTQAIQKEVNLKAVKATATDTPIEPAPIRAKDATLALIQELDEDIEYFKEQEEIKAKNIDFDSLPTDQDSLTAFKNEYLDKLQDAPNTNRPYSKEMQNVLTDIHTMLNIKPESGDRMKLSQVTFPERLIGLYVENQVIPAIVKAQFGVVISDDQATHLDQLIDQYMTLRTDEKVSRYLSNLCQDLALEENGSLSSTSIDEIQLIRSFVNDYENYRSYALQSSSVTLDDKLAKKEVTNNDYRCLKSIEYSNGFVLRANQVDTIKAMLNEESVIKQLGMGQGKSSVILPFLLNSYADGNTLALGIVPEGLYPIVAGELTESCKNIFSKDLYRFEFSRDLQVSGRKLKEIYINFGEAIKNKSPVITTRTSLLSFRNMYIEKMKQHQLLLKNLGLPDSTNPITLNEDLQKFMEEGKIEAGDLIKIINNIDDLRYMAKTLSLLKSNSKAICDEVDSILDVQIELNYAFGELANIDPSIVNAGIDVFTKIHTLASSDHEHNELFDMIRTNQQTFLSAENRFQVQKSLAETYFSEFKTFLLSSGFTEDQLLAQGYDIESFTSYMISSSEDESSDLDLPQWLTQNKDLHFSDPLGSLQSAIGNIRKTIQALETTLQKSNLEGYGRGHNGIDTVPYKASNSPSNSEYGDVFERIAYTLQDYYQQGLSDNQVNEYLDGIVKQIEKEISLSILTKDIHILPQETQAYKKFQKRLKNLKFKNLSIYDLKSDSTNLQAYTAKLNASPENQFEFLQKDVFPFFQMANNQISSNAFDLVDMLGDFNGFTGTPWNVHSFHSKLNKSNAVTKGTEGRLGQYLQSEFENGNVQIHTFKSTDDDGNPLPANELFQAMSLASRGGDIFNYDAMIDAGALCKEYTLNEVVSTLSKQVSGKEPVSHSGIIYVNEENNKRVLKNSKESLSVTNDSLDFDDAKPKPGECFTFYDQIHVIGTDIKQSKKARALVTISEKTMIKDLKQAIARMRGLRQGQHIDFIISERVQILILEQRQEIINKLSEEISFATEQNLDQEYIEKLQVKLNALQEKSDDLDIDDIRHFCIANQAKRVAELNTRGQMMEINSKLPQTAFWNMTEVFANTFDPLFEQIEDQVDLTAEENVIEKSLEDLTPSLILSSIYTQQAFNVADQHLVTSTEITDNQKIQKTAIMEAKTVLEMQIRSAISNFTTYNSSMTKVKTCHEEIGKRIKTESERESFIADELNKVKIKYDQDQAPQTGRFNLLPYTWRLDISFEQQKDDLKEQIASKYDRDNHIVPNNSSLPVTSQHIAGATIIGKTFVTENGEKVKEEDITIIGTSDRVREQIRAGYNLCKLPILEERYLTKTMQTSTSSSASSKVEVETQREQERETETEIKKVAQAVNTHVKRSAIKFSSVNQLWSMLKPDGFAHSLNTLNDNYSENIFISDNIVQKNANAKSELKKHPRVTPETCIMLTNTRTGEVKCLLIDINDYEERIKPLLDKKKNNPKILLQVMPLQVSSQSRVYDTNVDSFDDEYESNALNPNQTNLLIQSKHYSQVYQLYNQNEKDAFEHWQSSWDKPRKMNQLYTNFILSPQKRERYLEYQKAV